MIDFQIIKFISLINELAEKSLRGLMPFSQAEEITDPSGDYEEYQGLYYDDSISDEENDEILAQLNKSNDIMAYRIVSDYILFCHHDIISCYGENENYSIYAIIPIEDSKPYLIAYPNSAIDNERIVIVDGRWYTLEA